MAEPQPPNIHEGADFDDEAIPKPASKEDAKAAAALSSLDARGDDDDKTGKKSEADQKALGEAMSRLAILGDKSKESSGAGGSGAAESEAAKKADEEAAAAAALAEKRRKVKVDAADVSLLVSVVGRCVRGLRLMRIQVEELELSKVKATELLKAHEGDAVKAMTAFVKATA